MSRLYGAVARDQAPGQGQTRLRRLWVLLDPTLRVIEVIPFRGDRSDIDTLIATVGALPPPSRFPGFEVAAPVIVLPNVLEPAFCERLIGLYEAEGGAESGFMRDVGGTTVGITNHSHKRRKDHMLADREAISGVQARFLRRVVPEIAKVHQFHVT